MRSRPHWAGEASPSPFPPVRVETRTADVPERHWFARLFGGAKADRPSSPAGASASNPLLAFASETAAVEDEISTRQTQSPRRMRALPTSKVLVACGVVVVVAGAFALRPIQNRFSAWPAAPQAATLTLETRPAGAEVSIDGQRRGESPLTLSLSPGTHTMTLRRGREERTVPLMLTAGAAITQYLEFTSAAPPVVLGGR